MGRKLKIEKTKKKNSWNLFKTADEFISEKSINSSHTEIFGNNKIITDGCLGVFEYKDTYLKLKLRKGNLIICGNGFEITHYENHSITVKGEISSVEFCCG